jgi:hypothetical protein
LAGNQLCLADLRPKNKQAIPSANFQNLGRVLLSFSAQGRYEGVGGLLLAMGQDYSSAVQAEVRVRA